VHHGERVPLTVKGFDTPSVGAQASEVTRSKATAATPRTSGDLREHAPEQRLELPDPLRFVKRCRELANQIADSTDH
jgi:hypothetical protein